MTVSITFQKSRKAKADTIVIPVFAGKKLSPAVKKLGDGFVTYGAEGDKKFTGKAGQSLVLSAPKGAGFRRAVLVGLGDAAKLTESDCEAAGGRLYGLLNAAGAVKAAFLTEEFAGLKKLNAAEAAAAIGLGIKLRSYSFDKYKNKKKPGKDAPPKFEAIEFAVNSVAKAKALYADSDKVAKGVFFARDCVNEPPNVKSPANLARRISNELKPLGVQVEIFDEKKMQKLGFHAHLAVGMGSSRPPRVVVMRWNGKTKGKKGSTAKPSAPLAFVGKGVTFDTGGVNLKPASGMLDMKMDMAGAAAVAGLMKALALRKAKVDVVAIAGLAENMPSHTAYRPSDIIKSLSGQSIEVMNTDAEGRLVLADCMTYVQKTYKPRLMVDLATLTGAILVALGHEYCGAFVNDETLWKHLDGAGGATGEKLWRMPLDQAFKKQTEGYASDLKSTGNGPYGGSCTAAGFLEHFVEGKTPWAHLDIAGTAWIGHDTALGPKPATGYGVRLLNRMIADHYEG